MQWLWPTLIQAELDGLVNKLRIRKDKTGVSLNEAMGSYRKFGSENCVQPVAVEVIDRLMEEIRDEVLQPVSPRSC